MQRRGRGDSQHQNNIRVVGSHRLSTGRTVRGVYYPVGGGSGVSWPCYLRRRSTSVPDTLDFFLVIGAVELRFCAAVRSSIRDTEKALLACLGIGFAGCTLPELTPDRRTVSFAMVVSESVLCLNGP